MELDDFLVPVAALIVGALFIFLAKPKEEVVVRIARFDLYMSIFLAVIVWFFNFVAVDDSPAKDILKFLLDLGRIFSHLLLGYLLAYIFFDLKNTQDGLQVQKIIFLTLLAVSIGTGNSFLVVTAHKFTGFPQVKTFFLASGYPVWFLYLIIAAETLGAIGILLHSKLKTGPLASVGLIVIMLGAVYTLLHNHSPFSDTFAALSQLIVLVLLLVLYSLEKKAKKIATSVPVSVA